MFILDDSKVCRIAYSNICGLLNIQVIIIRRSLRVQFTKNLGDGVQRTRYFLQNSSDLFLYFLPTIIFFNIAHPSFLTLDSPFLIPIPRSPFPLLSFLSPLFLSPFSHYSFLPFLTSPFLVLFFISFLCYFIFLYFCYIWV